MAKQTKFLLTHTQQPRIHINNPFPPPTQKHHQRSSIHQPRKNGKKKKKNPKTKPQIKKRLNQRSMKRFESYIMAHREDNPNSKTAKP